MPLAALADTSPQGDAFITSSIAEPVNLIPFLATDSSSHEITALIFNGLVKYDENLNLVGDLAERWDIEEDGLLIRFHLRKNVRWQDGVAFTAGDVRFTYEKMIDPKTPTPYGADFEKIQSIDTPDDFTVVVRYKEAYSPGLASWGLGIVPRHLLEHEELTHTEFSRRPVGTGPYKLFRWNSNESLELRANAQYFEGAPKISRYVYRVIPDTTTSFLELQTGNLDTVSLTPLQFQKQTDTAYFKKNYDKYRYASPGYVYLGYNLKNPLFSDVRVRNAIGLAIHKKEIVDFSLLGMGRVSTGPFIPESWAYNTKVKESDFDPDRARKLLAEAGFKDENHDGVLEKDEKNFSFTVLLNQGNEQRKMAGEIIQRRLKDVGIDMKIRSVEWGTLLKEFIDKKNFDAVLLAWQLSPDPDLFDIFHSSKTKHGEFNFVSYANHEVDKLIEAGRKEFVVEKRAQIYHKLHEILSREEPYTFLYVPEVLTVVHRRFRQVHASPIGIGYNFIHWYVPHGEQKYHFSETLVDA